jgi:hypothetical protein
LKERPLFVMPLRNGEVDLENFWLELDRLSESQMQQFLLLRDNGSTLFTDPVNTFLQNCTESRMADGSLGVGMFTIHSRFNHSCIPNASLPTPTGGTMSEMLVAAKDIAPGEEITFDYSPANVAKTRQERHESLEFACDCKACTPGTQFQRASDMRRRLIRGLLYLRSTEDVGLSDQPNQTRDTPIICDPTLKKAADTLSLPITSRFIYDVTRVFLMEQEGILTPTRADVSIPVMLMTVARMFKTERNRKIAELTMKQKTWLDRVCVAFNLWGERDAIDDDLPAFFRNPPTWTYRSAVDQEFGGPARALMEETEV